MSRRLVEDESGDRWLVEAGDPAREAVNRLGRAGFSWVVLPDKFLRGTMTVAEAQEYVVGLPVSVPRDYRLRDCVSVLGG